MHTLLGVGVSGGVQWAARPDLSLGLSVRSPVMVLEGERHEERILTGKAPDVFAELERSNTDGGTASVMLPARVRIGVAWQLGAQSISIDADAQAALRNTDFEIDRLAVFNARLGYRRELSPGVSLGAGLFTDRAADRPSDDFLARRAHFYGGTLGVSYVEQRRLNDAVERAEHLDFGTTFALRYAYGSGTLAGFERDNSLVLEDFTAINAPYTVHEFGLYVGASVRF